MLTRGQRSVEGWEAFISRRADALLMLLVANHNGWVNEERWPSSSMATSLHAAATPDTQRRYPEAEGHPSLR